MKRSHLLLCLVLMLLAAGCRRFGGPVATAIIADTPTPRSTPLPTVATEPAPGATNNPLALVIINPGGGRSNAALTRAAGDLEEIIAEEIELTVEVTVVNSQAEAYAALCGSGRGQVSAVWVNGMTYAAALESGCGEAVLQIERGTGRTVSTGEQVRLIANRAAGIQSVTNLGSRPFCRVSVDDFYSWFVPSLMLRANGLDPLNLQNIVDLGDVADVIAGVAEGRTCAAGGVSTTDFNDFADADQEADIAFIGQPVVVPYAVMMLPSSMPLGVRWALTEGMQSIANDPDRAETLETLLDQSRVIPADASDFTTFVNFLRTSGVDLAALGGSE